MYFKDKAGRMWLQTDNGFRNIGVSVKEETVTFKKIPSIEGAVPMTVRQAVSKLGITEESPLQPLKNLNNLEV